MLTIFVFVSTVPDDLPLVVSTDEPRQPLVVERVTLGDPYGPFVEGLLGEGLKQMDCDVARLVACAGFWHGAHRQQTQPSIDLPDDYRDYGYRLASPSIVLGSDNGDPIPWVRSEETDAAFETPIRLASKAWRALFGALNSGVAPTVFHHLARAGMNCYANMA